MLDFTKSAQAAQMFAEMAIEDGALDKELERSLNLDHFEPCQ